MTALLVALAGGTGAALRYLTALAVPGARATLLVNVVGSFALGALVGASAGHGVLTVVGVGLLGGFTTFSAASVEVAQAWLEDRRGLAVRWAVLMAFTCIAAATAGRVLFGV